MQQARGRTLAPEPGAVVAPARPRQRVGWRLEAVNARGLDLDAGELRAPAGEDVHLPPGRAQPAGEDAPALPAQVARRQPLAQLAQLARARLGAPREVRGEEAQPGPAREPPQPPRGR